MTAWLCKPTSSALNPASNAQTVATTKAFNDQLTEEVISSGLITVARLPGS